MIKGILVSFILTLLTAGCSMQKDMDNMVDATGEMKSSTAKLSRMSDNLGISLPIGMGLDAMRTGFKKIENDDTGDTTKLAEAAAYYEAMPYQFWTGSDSNDQSERDDEMYNDIQYTLFNVDQYIDHKFEIPDSVGLSENNYRILSAMAAAMSELHPFQIRLAKQNHFKAMSVYDIITDALLNKAAYRASKNMPKHVEVVLRYENECKYLLQIRHNHLLLIATSFLTYVGDKSLFQKMWEIISATKFSQRVELAQFSNERLAWINTVIVGAQDTRNVLTKLHTKLKVSDGVKKLFMAMKPIKSNSIEGDTDRPKIEDDLINNMNSLSKQME